MRIDWLVRWRSRINRPRRPLSHSRRVEHLEDRALLAAFVVNSTLDTVDASPGDGIAADAGGRVTLRAAIQEANAMAGGDTITLPAGTFRLALLGQAEQFVASGDLDLRDDVTITGAGANQTIIDGFAADRVFDVPVDVPSSVNLQMADLTIKRGSASLLQEDGGGIRSYRSLTLQNVVLSDNGASGGGGAIASLGSASTLTITNSTLDVNVSSGLLGGGAIYTEGITGISGSVLSNNSSAYHGGAIANVEFSNPASATLLLSTLSGNAAANNGGGLFNARSAQADITDCTITANSAVASGGGLFRQGTISLSGTVLALNTAGTSGPNLSGMVSSLGFNLIGSTSGGSGFVSSDFQNVADPKLGPLQDNGGPTWSRLLTTRPPQMECRD
jgi:CSLREA domain-containing protein